MNVAPAVLTAFVEELFVAAKLRDADARLCAEIHVLQEMRGVTTHGLRHIPLNLDALTKGQMNPSPNRAVLHDEAATVVLDGDQGVGILGCVDAMDRAVMKAKQYGVGIGIVINNNHFLSAAPYCLRAIEEDTIGICCSNTWGSMGYPGTNVRAIAYSPIGFGIPNANEFPVVFDAALTTSGGKLAQWIREIKTIPPRLLGIGKEGNPSTDPQGVLHGGTPWPIGDHKGAGLAVLVEVLTGVLGGGAFLHGIQPPGLRKSKENAESQCCIAIDIVRFMPMTTFEERTVAFIADLKSNPLAPGYAEILLPGERAHRAWLRCQQDGVALEADVAEELRSWSLRLNVACPF